MLAVVPYFSFFAFLEWPDGSSNQRASISYVFYFLLFIP
jgi:hypothetical protein